MKILPTLSTNYWSYSMIIALMSITLCSCIRTANTGPTISSSLSTSSQAKQTLKKKPRHRFNKKPEDAIKDFNRDNRGGRLRLKQYGAPGPTTPYYNKLLEEDLGVKIDVIGDGLISPDTLKYAKQYNSLMVAEIQRKYGPGILAEAQRRAEILRLQSRSGIDAQ